MNKYTIEQISRKAMTSSKTGKEYESVGLKIDGEWYNGFGKKGVTDQWDSGMEITGIELYQNGNYKNWRLISLESRIDELEKRILALENKQLKAPF